MSDGSWCEDKYLKYIDKPLTTIGAEDLVKFGATRYGYLRRERKFGKIGDLLGKSSIKWVQVYVVVSQGCVYIFDSDRSKSAKTAFLLSGYSRVCRWNPPCDISRYGFEIIPQEQSTETRKSYQFSAANSDDVYKWVRHIHGSIMLVNGHKITEQWFKTQFDLAEIEKPVLPPMTSKEKDIEESHYDTIDEADFRRSQRYKPFPTTKKKPPPPIPTDGDTYDDTATGEDRTRTVGAVGISRAESIYENTSLPQLTLSDKTRPLYANDPTQDSDNDSVHSYENANEELKQNYIFPSTDTDKAKQCLLDKPIQTFLIRDATTPGKKTLQIKLKNGISKYQIDIQNGKFYFPKASQSKFDSLSEFVKYYQENPLPDGKARLGEGYRFFDTS